MYQSTGKSERHQSLLYSWERERGGVVVTCDGVGHVPEHWKIRKTSVPFILMGEGEGG